MNQHAAPALLSLTLAIGLLARLYLATFHGSGDQDSFALVASLMSEGKNIYRETIFYNYTPFWAYCLLALPLHTAIKSFLTMIDLGNALLIGILSVRLHRSFLTGFAAYWLNPAAILLVGWHGQFETLAAFPLLLALVVMQDHHRRHALTPPLWFLVTLTIIIKHILIFSSWTLLLLIAQKRVHALLLFIASITIFLFTFIPYLPEGREGIAGNVLGYSADGGLYGFGTILPRSLSIPLFLLAMTGLPFLSQHLRLHPVRSMELAAVGLITFIFGIGQQYFLLPLLFGGMAPGLWYRVYTAGVTLLILGAPHGLHIPGIPSMWNLVWMISMGWFMSFFVVGNMPIQVGASVHAPRDEGEGAKSEGRGGRA